jgi:hypothetical protein
MKKSFITAIIVFIILLAAFVLPFQPMAPDSSIVGGSSALAAEDPIVPPPLPLPPPPPVV